MPSRITSLTNPRIKQLVKLKRQLAKNKTLAIVEGIKEVAAALKAKAKVKEVYVCSEYLNNKTILQKLSKHKEVTFELTSKVFDKVSFGDRKEGILVVCEIPSMSINDLTFKKNGLYVLLENIEKPGNLGAILRTCDGVGVDAVILVGYKSSIYNSQVIRNSLGAVFTNCVIEANQQDVFGFFNKNKIAIVATTPEAKKKYTDVSYASSVALCMGEEHAGLSDFWLSKAKNKCRIPMEGAADSLNVSCATAVVLYEIKRQRG